LLSAEHFGNDGTKSRAGPRVLLLLGLCWPVAHWSDGHDPSQASYARRGSCSRTSLKPSSPV
jgi:hypothetical protein